MGTVVWIIRFKNYLSKLKVFLILVCQSHTLSGCMYSRIPDNDIRLIVGFKVLTAVLMKLQVFWNKLMTPQLQMSRQSLLPPSARPKMSLILDCVDQGWRTHDMRKGFLDMRHLLMSTVFIFLLSDNCLSIAKSMYTYLTAEIL